MLVEQIRFDAAKFLAIIDLNAHIIIEGTDRCSLIEKDIFGLVENLRTLAVVWFQRRGGHQIVVPLVTPAGTVIAAAGDETVNESVRIIVVADPTGPREIIVKAA